MSNGSKRIRLEQDDDLFLLDLSQRFASFCDQNTDEQSIPVPVTSDELFQRLNEHDLRYRSSIQLNFDQIQAELQQNEEKTDEMKKNNENLKSMLVERKNYLKQAKLKRRHESDYTTTINVINRLPSRDQLEKQRQLMLQELEKQKSELNHLNQRLLIYQKQSKVVLYSLLELVGFIDVKLPINFEDEIGRLDSNPLLDQNVDK